MAPHPLSPSPIALPPTREGGNVSVRPAPRSATTARMRPPRNKGFAAMGSGPASCSLYR